MKTYTSEFTETEDLAMQYISYSVDDWLQNAAHERARVAIDEIIKIAVDKFLEAGQSIPGSKDEIVAAAYSNGWITTAKEKVDSVSTVSQIPTL